MAKAEIGVYLAAHFNDFKQGLAKAAAEVKGFKDKVGGLTSGFTGMTGSVAKVVPAVGALSGGIEIFNKLIGSSQELTDAWGRTMEAAENVMTSFFVALGSGNFSGFISGLDGVIQRAREAYDAIDRLGSIEIFDDTDQGEMQLRMDELNLIIAKKEKAGQDVTAEKAELKELEQKQIDYFANLQKEYHDAEVRVARAVISKYADGSFTNEQLDAAAEQYLKNFTNYDSIVAKLDELSRLEREMNDAFKSDKENGVSTIVTDLETGIISTETAYGAALKKFTDYKAALGGDEMIKLLKAIQEVDDDSLKKILEIRKKSQQQRQAVIKAEAAREKETKTKTPKDKAEALNKKLLESENKLAIAQLGVIEDKNLRELEISRKTHEQKLALLKDEYTKAKTWQEQLTAENKYMTEQLEYTTKLNDKLGGFDKPVSTIKPIVDDETIKKEMLDALAKVQGQITPLKIEVDTEDFLKELEYCANAIEALGQSFSNLGQVYESESLSAAGIITTAIANLLKGYAAASAQASKQGPWAWAAFTLAGLAEVTSVVSQVKNLSKFADGGIVSGSTTVGDRQLARVNAGEMILNGRQQSSLFRQLNHGESLASGKRQGGQVDFRIRGSELVGVLSNYNLYRH